MGKGRDRRRRKRRERRDGATPAPKSEFTQDASVRWRSILSFTFRRRRIATFVPLGIVVDARTPEELEEQTCEELAQRTRGQRPN